jgi:hypothetical protein
VSRKNSDTDFPIWRAWSTRSRDLGVGVETAERLPVVFLEFAEDNGMEFALLALDVLLLPRQ